jgi:hypothetical protein
VSNKKMPPTCRWAAFLAVREVLEPMIFWLNSIKVKTTFKRQIRHYYKILLK